MSCTNLRRCEIFKYAKSIYGLKSTAVTFYSDVYARGEPRLIFMCIQQHHEVNALALIWTISPVQHWGQRYMNLTQYVGQGDRIDIYLVQERVVV